MANGETVSGLTAREKKTSREQNKSRKKWKTKSMRVCRKRGRKSLHECVKTAFGRDLDFFLSEKKTLSLLLKNLEEKTMIPGKKCTVDGD